MTETSVSLDIVESCIQTGPGSCSLEWALEDTDNDDPECYLIGTSHLVRLYESPETLSVQTFNSNGTVNYIEDITESITDEYIVFSGEQTSDLSKVMHSDFAYTLIGNAYGINGEVLSSLTFTIQKGTKQILASVPCYAIIKVNYTSIYSSYKFSGDSEGKLLLVAIATCESNNNEQILDTMDVDLWETCENAEEDRCLTIEIKIDTSSDEGSNYDSQGKKLIKVWGATIDQITYAATLGSVTFLGSVDETVEEEISGCGADGFSTSDRVYSIVSQSVTSGNLNSFTVEDGELKMLTGGSAVGGIPKGYGTLSIKYVTRYLKFLIESSRDGKGVFIVDDLTYEECEITCLEYELGEDTGDGEELYDITVIYKDFVTGAPIGEARVWVDDKYIGQTNADGEIDIEQVSAGKKHLIKASRPGYLNTDSDSLTNDSFIIPES